MPVLEIFFFGQFEVIQNGKKIEHPLWQSRQVRSILKFLAAAPGKPLSNSQLIELLWPGEDASSAQQRLYVRISQLRKVLENPQGHEWIQSVEGGYALALPHVDDTKTIKQDCWIDVNQFEEQAELGRAALEEKQFQKAIASMERARSLYRADYLLEDLYLEWTVGERERLRDLYLITLTELAEAYAQTGAYRRAINICRQILSVEPYREAVFLRLMLYYYYAGEKGKALQVFQQCEQVLQQELGVLPDRTSYEIVHRIERGNLWDQADLPHYPPPAFEGRLFEVPYSLGEVPFCGREREYAWLIQQWSEPDVRAILLEGEAGIGKTRLADEFGGYVASQGKPVFKLRGINLENQPYSAWIKFLMEEPAWLKETDINTKSRNVIHTAVYGDTAKFQVEPHSLMPHQPANSLQLGEALQELLQRMIVNGSLVYVDDAHLLDPKSLNLLFTLPTQFKTLLVCRTEETLVDHPVRRLLTDEVFASSSLLLKPIELNAVSQLLGKLGTVQIPDLAEKLFGVSEGNPLFIISSLQHLFEEGILYVNIMGEWESSGDFEKMLSPSLEQIIALRLKQVRSPDRRVLDVLSVAGGEIDYDILQAVLEVEESALLHNADTLIDLGLLVEARMPGEAELTLPHACYRDVLYQSLPDSRRRIYHRRLAEVMLKSGKATSFNAAVLAQHFYKGGAHQEALQFMHRAGDFALGLYAPQQALKSFQTALEWLPPLTIQDKLKLESELRLGVAEALRLSGDYPQAIKYYQDAFPQLEGELKTVAAYQILQLRVLQGGPLNSFDELSNEFEESLEHAGPTWALALLYWGQAFIALMRGDPLETRHRNARGWRIARELSEMEPPPGWICQRAFTVLMRAHNQWGNFRTSMHFSKRILQLIDEADQSQDQNTLAAVHAALGESYLNLGLYQQASEKFKICYDIALKASDPRLQGDALIGLGSVRLECGNFKDAAEKAHQVLQLVDQNVDIPRQVNANLLLAEIEILQSPKTETVALLENYLELARFQDARPYCVRILLLLAQAKISRQEISQAQDYAREALAMAEHCKLKRQVSIALRLLADVKGQQGGFEAGCRFAERSAAWARRIEAPFEHAQALVSWSAMHPDSAQRLKLLQKALSIFYKLGAEFETARVRQQLQELSYTQ